MIVGTSSIDTLAASAATIDQWLEHPIELGDVECFQLTAEMRNTAREAVLPPALHPTVPPGLSIQALNVGVSPWGEFLMVVTRVTCRSGVRARGFTTQLIANSTQAAAGLSANFGYPAVVGNVTMRRHYDGVDLDVHVDDASVLSITALDPDPMGIDDVQYTGTLNLAHSPNGLRLVQVEANHSPTRVERLTSRINTFDGQAWGNPLLDPYFVVSSSIALETISMPAPRFVCKPDELAFTGTEKIA